MSASNLLSLDTVLIASRAVILLAAFAAFAWGFIRWRRASERDAQRIFEQLDLVRSDLLIMKEVMQSAANRVDTAAKQVAHDVRLAPTQNNGTGRGYEIAARLARGGAAKEELIKSCGITTHEAELLVRLHGRGNAPATPAPKTAAPVSQAVRAVQTAIVQKAPSKAAPVEGARDKAVDGARTAPRTPAAPQVRSRLVAVG